MQPCFSILCFSVKDVGNLYFCLCGDLGDGLRWEEGKCDVKIGKVNSDTKSSPYSFPLDLLYFMICKITNNMCNLSPKTGFFFF